MNLFDLHCDTATVCADKGFELTDNALMASVAKKKGIEKRTQLFAIYLSDELSDEQAYVSYQSYLENLKTQIKRHETLVKLCKTTKEITAAHDNNQCAAVLAIENGSAIGARLENIEKLALDGVKAITLTWNGENALARGIQVGGGLKPFGKEAVIEMYRNGIVPDISHLSDKGVEDIFLLTENTVIASHSNIRSVCKHPRNMPEEFFKELVRRKGLCGINLYIDFLANSGNPAFDDLLRHIERMLELGGADIIAFGSDFDGADMPEFCRDINDISALYSRLENWYDKSVLDKLFYENADRFFQTVLH